MTETEIYAAMWARTDVVVLAIGIYMERHRIGWWAARDELYREAADGGVTVDILAEQVVRRLDQRRR